MRRLKVMQSRNPGFAFFLTSFQLMLCVFAAAMPLLRRHPVDATEPYTNRKQHLFSTHTLVAYIVCALSRHTHTVVGVCVPLRVSGECTRWMWAYCCCRYLFRC